MTDQESSWRKVKFDDRGLVPAIVQDAETGDVLMLGYMNMAALQKTLADGKVTFWSRSRQKLWQKGETSGHIQEVVDVRLDCDGDTLLVLARQHGPGACHEGYRSCFHFRVQSENENFGGKLMPEAEPAFDPQKVYGG